MHETEYEEMRQLVRTPNVGPDSAPNDQKLDNLTYQAKTGDTSVDLSGPDDVADTTEERDPTVGGDIGTDESNTRGSEDTDVRDLSVAANRDWVAERDAQKETADEAERIWAGNEYSSDSPSSLSSSRQVVITTTRRRA